MIEVRKDFMSLKTFGVFFPCVGVGALKGKLFLKYNYEFQRHYESNLGIKVDNL